MQVDVELQQLHLSLADPTDLSFRLSREQPNGLHTGMPGCPNNEAGCSVLNQIARTHQEKGLACLTATPEEHRLFRHPHVSMISIVPCMELVSMAFTFHRHTNIGMVLPHDKTALVAMRIDSHCNGSYCCYGQYSSYCYCCSEYDYTYYCYHDNRKRMTDITVPTIHDCTVLLLPLLVDHIHETEHSGK